MMNSSSAVLQRNIDALHKKKIEDKLKKTLEEKVADVITKFSGSMLFVYIHMMIYGLWIFWNLGWMGFAPFDPTFVVLAMFASVEAIFLSTFVLISQNRMNLQADKRADLDLQVNLLTEHELTKLISLVSDMAKKMGIEQAHDPEITEIKEDIRPEVVLTNIENQHKSGT